MIIDSHAHYNHNAFSGTFRYLTRDGAGYALQEGDRALLLDTLRKKGLRCAIEPGIGLASCREILALCDRYPDFLFPAMGVHPTRCIRERWADRKQLMTLAKQPGVVAIGETGLDYHEPREAQHRLTQHLWFLYHLKLAQKAKLPLILHIRDAHRDALRILRHHPARKLGGVVHCFSGDSQTAAEYTRLGLHLGIGGTLLQQGERALQLQQAVIHTPLEFLLLETDAPFILPYCKDTIPSKQVRRARNTSLILPAVAEKIAELKGIPVETVLRATAENTIALFSLPISLEN